MRAPCHQGEGSLHLAHANGLPCYARHSSFHPGKEFCPADIPPSPDISHPDGRGGRFNFPGQTCPDPLIGYFTSRYLTAGWERRTFQLTRSDMSGSSDSAYLESFSLSIQCRDVLLKLLDIFDRLFEIFCFRYLMSKSPNSPCNPPIIGFLSL